MLLCYSGFATMAVMLLWPLCYYGRFASMVVLLLWSLCYYGGYATIVCYATMVVMLLCYTMWLCGHLLGGYVCLFKR